MATKKKKTAEQKLAELEQYLTEEIQKSEAVLADPFMRSNLDGLDLGIHAQNIGYYTNVLKKMESL
jgi:hypothetical protein